MYFSANVDKLQVVKILMFHYLKMFCNFVFWWWSLKLSLKKSIMLFSQVASWNWLKGDLEKCSANITACWWSYSLIISINSRCCIDQLNCLIFIVNYFVLFSVVSYSFPVYIFSIIYVHSYWKRGMHLTYYEHVRVILIFPLKKHYFYNRKKIPR